MALHHGRSRAILHVCSCTPAVTFPCHKCFGDIIPRVHSKMRLVQLIMLPLLATERSQVLKWCWC